MQINKFGKPSFWFLSPLSLSLSFLHTYTEREIEGTHAESIGEWRERYFPFKYESHTFRKGGTSIF